MKILHVTQEMFKTSGVATFCKEIAAEQMRAGHEVRALVQGNYDLKFDEGVKVVVGPSMEMVGVRPDIVHIHGLWAPFSARAMTWCRQRGIPYVVSPHGCLMPRVFKKGRLKKHLFWSLALRKGVEQASLIHCTAEAERQAVARFGFEVPYVIAPLGVRIRTQVSSRHASLARRLLAEKKVEGWLEGVTRESFGAALEKMIELNLTSGIIQLRNANERGLIRDAALEFFDGFANRIVVLSDGRCVYFAPDQRSKKRGLDNSSAWAEYAIHATTNGGVLASGQKYHVRWFNPVKQSNFDLIEATLKKENCAPGIKKNPIADSIDFFGETHDGGKFVVIVRLDEYGNANANMTEVTFEASSSSKKKPPRLKPLAEAVEAVVHHQAAGTNPSTDNTIAKSAESCKGVRRRALFVSRMHPKKGVLELVESWARVRPEGWLCELVYTMNSEEERAYEQKVKDRILALGMSYQNKDGTIHCSTSTSHFDFLLTGPLDDEKKWDAYTRADLFVLPTYSENFGIVVAEALWAGVPVITTKGTPWKDLEDYECGWWIGLPPTTTKVGGVGLKWTALDDALYEACFKGDLHRKGEHGRRLVEKCYVWSAVCDEMTRGYNMILN